MKKNEKTNILYIIGSLSKGGAEMHLFRTLPLLIKKNYRITIFLISERGQLADGLTSVGIKIIEPWIKRGFGIKSNILFKLFRLTLVSLQLLIYLIFQRSHIIHFFLPASYLLGGIISLIAGKQILVMSRRSLNDYMKNKKIIQTLEFFLHKRMDFLLGNSKSVVKQLIIEAKDSSKVGLIYNGVDITKKKYIRKKIRDSWNIPETTFLMVIVANLISYKGHSDLFAALGQIKTRLGDWKLLVVGRDDGIGQRLQKQIYTLGLTPNVRFMGESDDVEEFLACSDVGLLVSHQEGFSNAILEGMAFGLPMIVTDVGGNAEAVIDGKTGLVVTVKDTVAIASAIIKLHNDSGLRLSMGKLGLVRVQSEFSIKKCVDQYDQIYSNLLNN